MKKVISLAAFFLVFLGGCSASNEMTFNPGSGDVGQFILRRAVACGGTPATIGDLPKIPGAWRFAEDQYGVVIQFPRENYEAVERLLDQAFGKPTLPSDDTADSALGCYRLAPKGGSIQFGHDDKGAQVIVLRKLTEQEFKEHSGRFIQN